MDEVPPSPVGSRGKLQMSTYNVPYLRAPEINEQRPHKTKVSIVEEEDVQRHQKGKGLTPLHPVLLDQDNDITINDIERIVEKASTFQNSSKSFKQIKEELQEVNEIIQEFMEGKNLHENENEHGSSNWEVNNLEENNRMKVLMAIMSDHKDRVNQMGSLMEKDIPRLCEDWKRSCKDIMNGALDRLAPLWEVNHQIPLIDGNKRYKYHVSRCPDSLKMS